MQKDTYTINDLEKITGIKAHTIRIWEKRYNLLVPQRTKSNIRYYTSDDLRKLLNIVTLNKNGLKISFIARLKEDEISEKVIEYTTRKSDVEDQVQALTMAMFNLDILKFEKLISVSFINRGFENTYTDIVKPFVVKIKLLWQTGTISTIQLNFAQNIIKQKLFTAIDGILPVYKEKNKYCVLFSPEKESDELDLLYIYYLLKKNHHHVTYLGCSVSFDSLNEINIFHNSDFLICSISNSFTIRQLNNYITNFSVIFPDQKILLLGEQVNSIENTLSDNVIKCEDISNIINTIEKSHQQKF
jgi:DNA-binding transcriptional MerR regulator